MISDITQATLFDYASLDSDIRAFLQEQEAELDCVLKRTSEEIGVILLKVKQRLPHGQYMPWLASRGISQMTAWRCMQVAQGKEIKKSIKMIDLPLVESGQIPTSEPTQMLVESTAPVDNIPMPTSLDFYKTLRQDAPARNVDNIPIAVPHISSKNNEWYTPSKYVEAARALMVEIDLDPASCEEANETVKAKKFYTKQDDGLNQSWQIDGKPSRVWLNPPYGFDYGSNQERWSRTLIERYEITRSVAEAVLLVNAAVDTRWFHELLRFPVCLTLGRINFSTPEPTVSGSTHGSAFVYFGPQPDRFVEIFSEFGTVVRLW